MADLLFEFKMKQVVSSLAGKLPYKPDQTIMPKIDLKFKSKGSVTLAFLDVYECKTQRS